MTINLLAVSTAKNTTKILKTMVSNSAGKIKLKLHLGDSNADFKASSLVRMNIKKGLAGHLLEKDRFYGVDHQLMASDNFSKDLETLIDQLYRHADAYRYKSHNLQNLQDYLDYYHILADILGEQIISKKIDHVLFFNIPHLVYDTIIYQLALSMKVDVTIVTQSLFPNKFFSLSFVDNFGDFQHRVSKEGNFNHKIPKTNLFYMKKIKQEKDKSGAINILVILNFLLYIFYKNPSKLFKPLYIFRLIYRIKKIYQAFPKWRQPFAKFFHTNELAYFEHLAQFEDVSVNLDEKYVYFPLAMQPEMTTSAIGGNYRDQVLAIEELSRILPQDVKIFVKENPKQGAYARGPLFFHRLARIRSVCFLPSYANTDELLQKSLFVATITGTVGWEALYSGKKVLIFGHAWYKNLSGTIQFYKGITFKEIHEKIIDRNQLGSGFSNLMEISHEGIIDRGYIPLLENYDEEKNCQKVAKTISHLINKKISYTFSRHK